MLAKGPGDVMRVNQQQYTDNETDNADGSLQVLLHKLFLVLQVDKSQAILQYPASPCIPPSRPKPLSL